jgi:Tfp pilus assembly protein PilF
MISLSRHNAPAADSQMSTSTDSLVSECTTGNRSAAQRHPEGLAREFDQTRIDLGVAYLKSGETKQARETFAAVKADSEWRGLAELWSVRAKEASQDAKQPGEQQLKK